MKTKHLILSLIKDDLVNAKLVYSLNSLGLNASNYFLHLSETVFQLMKIKENERYDELYERYLVQVKKAKEIDITESNQGLDKLAVEIYEELCFYKEDKLILYKNAL